MYKPVARSLCYAEIFSHPSRHWPSGEVSVSRAAELGTLPAFPVESANDLKTGRVTWSSAPPFTEKCDNSTPLSSTKRYDANHGSTINLPACIVQASTNITKKSEQHMNIGFTFDLLAPCPGEKQSGTVGQFDQGGPPAHFAGGVLPLKGISVWEGGRRGCMIRNEKSAACRSCHPVENSALSSSSSRSSDGNSNLPDEGGSASQVPQASVQLAGYGSVVWPDSLSEWLVGGAELQ